MGLEISKRFSSYSFHMMSVKLYEEITYHDGIQAITFLGNQPSFKTWGSMGKPKMWNISKDEKFGTRGTTVHIGRVLFMACCLGLVWGHSVHFANFPVLQF